MADSRERYCPTLHVQRSAYEIQMRAVPAAMRMEMRGFKLDVEAHAQLIEDLEQDRIAAEQKYPNGLPGNRPYGARRQSSVDAGAEGGIAQHSTCRVTNSRAGSGQKRAGSSRPHAANCSARTVIRQSECWLNSASIDKLLTSFGATLPALVSPVTGRIHAHYRIAATSTGRATCSGPNMQQIPRDRALSRALHSRAALRVDRR